MNRSHEVKALDNLLYAFSKYKDYNSNSFLIIAGDDHGFKKDLFEIIRKQKLQSDVFFTGIVHGSSISFSLKFNLGWFWFSLILSICILEQILF